MLMGRSRLRHLATGAVAAAEDSKCRGHLSWTADDHRLYRRWLGDVSVWPPQARGPIGNQSESVWRQPNVDHVGS